MSLFRNVCRLSNEMIQSGAIKSLLNTNKTRLLSSYFSVTREKLGRSEAEIKKEISIPEPPPIEIYHCKRDVKMGPKKMWYAADLVKRMPIEEAIAQSEFSVKGASEVVKEVLQEAQERAVQEYGLEDKSLLYVDQSYVGKGQNLIRIKFHGRGRFGKMKRYYCSYFCVLKEGIPPGKNIRRNPRYLPELERKLKHPKTIKNSLSDW